MERHATVKRSIIMCQVSLGGGGLNLGLNGNPVSYNNTISTDIHPHCLDQFSSTALIS